MVTSVHEVGKYANHTLDITSEYLETLLPEVPDIATFIVSTQLYLKHMATAKGDAGTAATIHKKKYCS
jgi:hypothetical protein